jgi:hypothetical protein
MIWLTTRRRPRSPGSRGLLSMASRWRRWMFLLVRTRQWWRGELRGSRSASILSHIVVLHFFARSRSRDLGHDEEVAQDPENPVRRVEGHIALAAAEQRVVAGRNRHCASDGALDPIRTDGRRALGDAPTQLRGPQSASIPARRRGCRVRLTRSNWLSP